MPSLIEILAQLATSIRQKLGEEGMVIWYDSVTIKVIIFTIWWCLPSFKRLKTFLRLTLNALSPSKAFLPQFKV